MQLRNLKPNSAVKFVKFASGLSQHCLAISNKVTYSNVSVSGTNTIIVGFSNSDSMKISFQGTFYGKP